MNNINIIINIFSIAFGFTGIFFGIISIFYNRFSVIRDYFKLDSNIEFLEARKIVYNSNPKTLGIENKHAALICNAFNFWALMAKKHYIPFWVFKGAPRLSIIKLYEILNYNISLKRKNNPLYAKEFEWLYLKLLKINKRVN